MRFLSSLLHALFTLLPVIPTFVSAIIIPHCYSEHDTPGFQPANLHECNSALREIAAEPGFRTRYRFSRNQRVGVKLPKWWRSGKCFIVVSCTNDLDANTFTYVDVFRKAKNVIDECVNLTDLVNPEISWGGIESVGTQGAFFVTVTGRYGVEPLGLANITEERGTE